VLPADAFFGAAQQQRWIPEGCAGNVAPIDVSKVREAPSRVNAHTRRNFFRCS